MRWKSESGQAASENLAVISVLVIAVVGAAYTFVPTFANGVDELAQDAKQILSDGKVGDTGTTRGSDGSVTTNPYDPRGSRTAPGSSTTPTKGPDTAAP